MRNYQRLFASVERTLPNDCFEREAWQKSIEQGLASCERAGERPWASTADRKPSPRLACVAVQTLHYFMKIGFRSNRTNKLETFSEDVRQRLVEALEREEKSQRIRNLKVQEKIRKHHAKRQVA